MTEPTDDTLEAMMLAMLEAANNAEGYVSVQMSGIGPGGEAEMRAVFRVVQAALAAQPQAEPSEAVLIDNLSTLVLRLARALKVAGNVEVADRALDFLNRHNIGPNPLRAAAAARGK